MKLKKKIIENLNVSETLIDDALKNAHILIKKFSIKKRTSGIRQIVQPSNKLKTIQYWLVHNVFNHLPIHESAVAYKKGLSVLDNAERHKSNKYFLKVDLENFFPSIQAQDLLNVVSEWHDINKPDWTLDAEAKALIINSCFDIKRSLPIGYPSSPIISNVVMYDFDSRVIVLLDNKDKYGDVIYTRYADDFVFSTNKTGACTEILKAILKEIQKCKSPKIKVNKKKTRFGSSSGGSAFITGLRVCHDGHITLHRKYKDQTRLMLSLKTKGELKKEDYSSLKGHLSYIKFVDPAFYTKLQSKYFKTIEILKDEV